MKAARWAGHWEAGGEQGSVIVCNHPLGSWNPPWELVAGPCAKRRAPREGTKTHGEKSKLAASASSMGPASEAEPGPLSGSCLRGRPVSGRQRRRASDWRPRAGRPPRCAAGSNTGSTGHCWRTFDARGLAETRETSRPSRRTCLMRLPMLEASRRERGARRSERGCDAGNGGAGPGEREGGDCQDGFLTLGRRS